MSVIVKEGLRDLVYKRLHQMIEENRFIPGSRINVEQLTEEMGVSRTPIWQAIGKLEKEGLLKSVPNKGVFIQVLSPEESVDLYSVREVLECMAAELAAVNTDARLLGGMEENLVKQRDVIATGDLVAYARLDLDFHEAVYKMSANSFLIGILRDIKKMMRPMVMHMNSILEELYQDHVAALDALRNGDTVKARESFRLHNERMKNLIRHIVGESRLETANFQMTQNLKIKT